MKVVFTVPGEPQGKARARTCRNGHTYTPENTVLYENLVKTEYERQCGKAMVEEGIPLSMTIIAHYSIPASWSKSKKSLAEKNEIRPTKKPDADNVAKVICDALNGVAYKDDTQVVSLFVQKVFGEPKTVVLLEWEATNAIDV